jgi:hypothetical protein
MICKRSGGAPMRKTPCFAALCLGLSATGPATPLAQGSPVVTVRPRFNWGLHVDTTP